MQQLLQKVKKLIHVPHQSLSTAQTGDTLYMSLESNGKTVHVPVRVISDHPDLLNVFLEDDHDKVAFYFDRAGTPRFQVDEDKKLSVKKPQDLTDQTQLLTAYFN